MTGQMSDRETWDFTKDGHEAAERDLYPKVFETLYGPDRMKHIDWDVEYHPGEYDDDLHDLDAKHGIDATVFVECDFRTPLPVYLQERWRDPDYQTFQDITITEWNKASGTPSELGKIKADHFAYGYYNQDNDEILEAVIVDVAGIKNALISGDVEYDDSYENHRRQTMVAISFEELARSNIQYLHYRDGCLDYNGYDGKQESTQESDQSVVVAKESVQSEFAWGDL